MREQDGMQVSTLQPPTTGDPKAWIAYWKAQAQTLGTEPEINAKRQRVQERKQLVGNGIKIENLIANGDQRWRK
jgi:hypothetical protein